MFTDGVRCVCIKMKTARVFNEKRFSENWKPLLKRTRHCSNYRRIVMELSWALYKKERIKITLSSRVELRRQNFLRALKILEWNLSVLCSPGGEIILSTENTVRDQNELLSDAERMGLVAFIVTNLLRRVFEVCLISIKITGAQREHFLSNVSFIWILLSLIFLQGLAAISFLLDAFMDSLFHKTWSISYFALKLV